MLKPSAYNVNLGVKVRSYYSWTVRSAQSEHNITRLTIDSGVAEEAGKVVELMQAK